MFVLEGGGILLGVLGVLFFGVLVVCFLVLDFGLLARGLLCGI